jgi:hypothetical protein
MRLAAWFVFIVIAAAHISVPAHAQSPDDAFKVYAVNVVHTPPLKKPFIGYGIYLGQGAVITAAHVVGRWPSFFINPRVLIAGQDLPAKIIKKGSADQIDLTLLSVDEELLPVSLRLRRNPLCKGPPQVGENVVDVVPDGTARSQIISPSLIPPEFQARFNTLISDAESSGSGVFDAERKCLLGIISRKILKYNYRKENGRIVIEANGFAGYFVPASQIADFIPADFRF